MESKKKKSKENFLNISKIHQLNRSLIVQCISFQSFFLLFLFILTNTPHTSPLQNLGHTLTIILYPAFPHSEHFLMILFIEICLMITQYPSYSCFKAFPYFINQGPDKKEVTHSVDTAERN